MWRPSPCFWFPFNRAAWFFQVLAGVLQVVAGLLPPHRHYSDIHDRIVTNYLWANGAHPFEPFGSSIHLSDTMVEVARRNEVLIRVDAAARHVRQAVSEVEAFYDQYLRDPFLGKSNAEESVWIDRLFHEVSPCVCMYMSLQLGTRAPLHVGVHMRVLTTPVNHAVAFL